MEVTLSASELAELKKCSSRWVRQLAKAGKLKGQKRTNTDGSPEWYFPVSTLPPDDQQKYFHKLKASLPTSPANILPEQRASKPLDAYSTAEREQIVFWKRAVDDWQGYRKRYKGSKAEADEKFCALRAIADPEHPFSVDTLYRRWKSIAANDLDGLIDKRGKWKQGKSSIDETVWQIFLYFFLDENQHPIKRCYDYTKQWVRQDFPDLFTSIATTAFLTR